MRFHNNIMELDSIETLFHELICQNYIMEYSKFFSYYMN